MRKVVAVALVAAALSGCAGPAKREYVLGAAGASENALAVQTALPVVQVERVQLPDYLDTRDILTRRDHQLVPSETGRWAERLSVGATRVLATSLGAHLKGVVVTSAQPVDPPMLRVVIDVTDVRLDRRRPGRAGGSLDGDRRNGTTIPCCRAGELHGACLGCARRCCRRGHVPGSRETGKPDFGRDRAEPGPTPSLRAGVRPQPADRAVPRMFEKKET